mgnify:FL=1
MRVWQSFAVAYQDFSRNRAHFWQAMLGFIISVAAISILFCTDVYALILEKANWNHPRLSSQYCLLVSCISVAMVTAMLLGGLRVMNTMQTAVNKRALEIAVRRAFGARRGDIRWLFLWEAVCISSIGGCLGAALGLLIGGLACLLLGLSFEPLLLPIGLALAASTLVGLLFGIAPANRAAKLSLLLANGFQSLNSSSALVVEPVKECN